MTDLTARQLLDTIRQSLDDTSQRFSRAKARKSIREGRAKSSPRQGGATKKPVSALTARKKHR